MCDKIGFISILPLLILLFGCKGNNGLDKANKCIHFAVSAEYPPFEYMEQGALKGFDIDIAKALGKELKQKVCFDNMQFSSILPALMTSQVDAAISTLTITKERMKNVDFSEPYYFEGMAAVFKKEQPIRNLSELAHKKIAAQMGSTMEIWLKKHATKSEIMSFDNNNQAIEALKAGHVDLVFIDGAQGAVFSQKNEGLSYVIVVQADEGYGIAFNKKSALKVKINNALSQLKEEGELDKLKKNWFGG